MKVGRKKAKKGDIPPPEQATPNTRARAAKEAAIRARLEAEQAEARAREVVEAAEAASRAVLNRVVPCEPVPLSVVLPEQSSPSDPMTRRKLSMHVDQERPSVQKCSMKMCNLLPRR